MKQTHRILPWLTLLLAATATHAAGPTGLLNDTGQTTCYDGSAMVACTNANTGDGATYPRQDGRFGRDKAGMAKVGSGAAGFDYTKICWNGDAEGSGTCTGTLVANTTATASGTPGTDWACTRDNVTNLVWSLHVAGPMTWFSARNSYTAGMPIYVANSNNRCGFNTGWRVPEIKELLSLVNSGVTASPPVDTSFFPAFVGGIAWSNDVYVPSTTYAWFLYLGNSISGSTGGSSADSKTTNYSVLLVHDGP